MEEDKKVIKEAYDKLGEIENLYIVPKSVYNEILKKISHLDDYLREARKSRDMWRRRYDEEKRKHKIKD